MYSIFDKWNYFNRTPHWRKVVFLVVLTVFAVAF